MIVMWFAALLSGFVVRRKRDEILVPINEARCAV
jgi:hypothetical protein